MEDASAVDLEWFWRGWFYTTDHVDLSIEKVHLYRHNSQNPDTEEAWERALDNKKPEFISKLRNKSQQVTTNKKPELLDFYNEHDRFTATNADRNKYNKAQKDLKQWEKIYLSIAVSFIS